LPVKGKLEDWAETKLLVKSKQLAAQREIRFFMQRSVATQAEVNLRYRGDAHIHRLLRLLNPIARLHNAVSQEAVRVFEPEPGTGHARCKLQGTRY
jgi:hypothetical protein